MLIGAKCGRDSPTSIRSSSLKRRALESPAAAGLRWFGRSLKSILCSVPDVAARCASSPSSQTIRRLIASAITSSWHLWRRDLPRRELPVRNSWWALSPRPIIFHNSLFDQKKRSGWFSAFLAPPTASKRHPPAFNPFLTSFWVLFYTCPRWSMGKTSQIRLLSQRSRKPISYSSLIYTC